MALALSGGGCMSAPPEVAADLTAPDGRRPNHYALQPGADEPLPSAEQQGAGAQAAAKARSDAGAKR